MILPLQPGHLLNRVAFLSLPGDPSGSTVAPVVHAGRNPMALDAVLIPVFVAGAVAGFASTIPVSLAPNLGASVRHIMKVLTARGRLRPEGG